LPDLAKRLEMLGGGRRPLQFGFPKVFRPPWTARQNWSSVGSGIDEDLCVSVRTAQIGKRAGDVGESDGSCDER